MGTVYLAGVHYRQEYVRCGRECKRCPHGPYWYAYFWAGDKLKKKYVGKELPEEVQAEQVRKHPLKADPQLMFFIDESRAWEIIGLPPTRNKGAVKARVASLLRKIENRIDVGGFSAFEVNEAWQILCSKNGWK